MVSLRQARICERHLSQMAIATSVTKGHENGDRNEGGAMAVALWRRRESFCFWAAVHLLGSLQVVVVGPIRPISSSVMQPQRARISKVSAVRQLGH